ncbi:MULTISPECIES: NAD(P)-binding protein [Nostoc]|uniref:NAD(P)-binding protein n=1 Tax=Nostoc paludosum FACHB-159 TaxID=2692908 RepID=A0ABR8KK46_9NOSO|nr:MULTISPECIES: NAD(P)-binding protein [Nostoc]MBD2683630.1 NAD(P)-binding protein [Nostoc sp. FACHB-857]MBD2739955.1 NAD(P)-binding protein [Nostoc paludosum FACHB-159]
MSEQPRKKIVILGGGMASLTTAFELTNQPDWKEKYEITVYQMGWRLGGKGASGRNLNAQARIEEHGLHILMGWYENTFSVLRQCYEELGRPADSPLATWQDAFKPHSFIASTEYINGQWMPWPYDFPVNHLLPGETLEFPTVCGYVGILIEFIIEQFKSEFHLPSKLFAEEEFTLSGIPDWLVSLLAENNIDLNIPDLPREAAFVYIARQLFQALPENPALHQEQEYQALLWLLGEFRTWLWNNVENIIGTHHKFRRFWIRVDWTYTLIRGIILDNLIVKGFSSIDDYDFQEWLRKHGAAESTINSVIVRSLYDLVFGYENGALNQPNLAAGVALRCFLRMTLSYKGALFWKMQAGMGDTIFVPFYEVLKQRGVEFKFFHRIKNLGLSQDTQKIVSIRLILNINSMR